MASLELLREDGVERLGLVSFSACRPNCSPRGRCKVQRSDDTVMLTFGDFDVPDRYSFVTSADEVRALVAHILTTLTGPADPLAARFEAIDRGLSARRGRGW